jgi:hypothetical protein
VAGDGAEGGFGQKWGQRESGSGSGWVGAERKCGGCSSRGCVCGKACAVGGRGGGMDMRWPVAHHSTTLLLFEDSGAPDIGALL